MLEKIAQKYFDTLDKYFALIDKTHIKRTKNLSLIPEFENRRGGKLSYAEWAHVVGIFQTLMYQNIPEGQKPNILDVGCGTGLLGIAAQPFVDSGGQYTGIDVMQKDIDFCKSNYPSKTHQFIHFNVANPMYAANQQQALKPWPIADTSQNMVVALSVWTHLSEADALFYFEEINRVLVQGGKAIVTFFYADKMYKDSLSERMDEAGRYHNTNQKRWIFDTSAYESEDWLTTSWAKNPEEAIAITPKGLQKLLSSSGLRLAHYYPGNWKERIGVYFQDVFIFEK